MADETATRLDSLSKLAQLLAVTIGVVVSVVSVARAIDNDAKAREADALARQLKIKQLDYRREFDQDSRRIEAAKPFLQMRLERYREAIKAAGILASPDLHQSDEVAAAKKRFWELYWAELSMVESKEVETAMVNLAKSIDPTRTEMTTPTQFATYELAHALRNSLEKNWGVVPSDRVEPRL